VRALVLLIAFAGAASAETAERFITLSSTTSTRDSGFFDSVLPIFEARTGIEVRVIAVGTGRALRLGEKGDVDAVLVHDRASELEFVARGYGIARREVMYNDFVVIGPSADPAGIRGFEDAAAALARIAESGAIFASRGDDSGTHKAELRLWAAAGVDARAASGTWYRETGSGMGATLNTASELEAYLLADRGTWISFKNRGDLQILVEGDPRLRNVYAAILVNPERHPHVKSEEARIFADWLVSEEGRAAIAGFRLGGMQLFHPIDSR
jgi:tungstate transport system substrate-binding protein